MAALTLSTYSTPAVSQANRRPTLVPSGNTAASLPGARTAGDGITGSLAIRSSAASTRASVANALAEGRVSGDGLGQRFGVSRQPRPGYGNPAFLGENWQRYGDNSGIWDTGQT